MNAFGIGDVKVDAADGLSAVDSERFGTTIRLDHMITI